MAFFEIRGGIPLRGSVTVSGAKNAALPIICASIMADEPCRIENLPDIEDVNRITEILSSMGAAITRPAPGVVVIDPRTIKSHSVTNEMQPSCVHRITCSVRCSENSAVPKLLSRAGVR